MRLAFLFRIFVILLVSSKMAAAEGRVLTTTPALAVLGQELAPAGVTVEYPGPIDVNASDWEADDDTLRQYQNADLILLVGAGYAGWVAKVALPRARLVDTSAGFRDLFISTESQGSDHRHGPTGETSHQHGAFANHFWLDPNLALLQAREIADAFIVLWPDNSVEIGENLSQIESELTLLQKALKQEFLGMDAQRYFGSHPVYQYLDRALGLNMHSFHWEPDQAPSPQEWSNFDELLGENGKSVMIWEGDPLPEVQDALAERNVDIVIISPSPQPSDAGLRGKLGFPPSLDK